MKIRARSILLTGLAVLLLAVGSPVFGAEKAKGDKVDLNSASQSELEALPGVGPALAKKIIDNRPYSSVSGLSKAGVPEATISKIRGLVKAGRVAREEKKEEKPAAKTEKAAAAKTEKQEARAEKKAEKAAIKSGEKVDLNSASQAELEALPGVGAATAKKIMQNRPYSSLADLSRAGVSASTMDKIRDKVKVGRAPKAERAAEKTPVRLTSRDLAPASTSREERKDSTSTSAGAGKSEPSAFYQAPPSKGMVWVNLDTKVYHREGDRWYGRTVHGKYMTEAEAIRAGNRLSKEKDEPAKP
jgi:DNA uptake protein ComE-like DNA-binding protein